MTTGEPDAVKAARPVRRGADGKVLRATGVTRRRPTLLYRPATTSERRDPRVMLYRHTSTDNGSVLVRRVTVAKHTEIVTAFCVACAEAAQTAQVLCYQRSRATGEVVGIKSENRLAA